MTITELSRIPAGWYNDPLGLPQVRWWNGLSWTTEVSRPRLELAVSGNFGSTTTA